MNTTFDDIVGNLSASNFDTLRGYILDVVRAEFGPLIQSLQSVTEIRSDEDQVSPDYSEGTGEPVETGETTEAEVPTFGEFLSDLGISIKGTRSKDHDQHLRFHALQMALAFTHENDKDPMVHANLFYGFLKGDA
jgi:hypothetical protein